MTQSKLTALESIGFTWARRKGQPSWIKRYNELIKYRKENGNWYVSSIQYVWLHNDDLQRLLVKIVRIWLIVLYLL